jgi:hypothetical protein
VSYRAVLEQARLCGAVDWPAGPRSLREPHCMLPIAGVLWRVLWEKMKSMDARPTAVRQSGAQDKHDEHAGARGYEHCEDIEEERGSPLAQERP